jgi:tRNA(Ile)-lysidine synthase
MGGSRDFVMKQKIIAFVKRHKMIEKNDHVIVGCSGGADSVCLLRVLHACREELGFSLSAVHVEHGIRGDESRRDVAFTEELCRLLEIPLAVCPVDAPSYAAAHNMGLEEAARVLRYEAFRQQAKELRGAGVKIALAHHMEDNAETMLFQLARGSGLAGLCGIPRVRREADICYIRPLLCVTREEIEAYLDELGQPYCTDRTNLDETYARNRIRRSILPQLTAVNAQAVLHMNQNAEKISEAYEFICEYAEKIYREQAVKEQGHVVLPVPKLRSLHPAVLHELLRQVLFEAAGHRKDISAIHVEQLERLMALQSGRKISLPYGLCAYMEYDALHVCRADETGGELSPVEGFWVSEEVLRAAAGERPCSTDGMDTGRTAEVCFCSVCGMDTGGPADACFGSLSGVCTSREAAAWFPLWDGKDAGSMRARVWRTQAPLEEITKKSYTKQFDYDKIKSGFFVRKRQAGDYFVLDSQGHKKKLSDYMVNEKIPARLRGSIPLLAQESEVLWVVGGRISASCRVTKDTTRIMEIEYNGGVSDGL